MMALLMPRYPTQWLDSFLRSPFNIAYSDSEDIR